MEEERKPESNLPIDELFDLFVKMRHYRSDAIKLGERMKRFTVSELNTMKKIVLNNYHIVSLPHYYQNLEFRFLCYILGYLKDTVSYTKNYEDMVKYLEKYPHEGPYGDPEFDNMLDRLSVPELYQALIGGNYGTNDGILRRIMDKIKEKEKNEEKKSKESKDRLLSNLAASPKQQITMMFGYLEELKNRLEKMEADNRERFELIMEKLDEIQQ